MKYELFKQTLLKAGITKKDFSNLTNIPLSTILGWATSRQNKTTPCWVQCYLDLYIENKNNKTTIKTLIKGIN